MYILLYQVPYKLYLIFFLVGIVVFICPVKQNIIFALGVKILVMVLGAFGIANMWLAVFADVGVALLAILNAMRALQ